MTSGNAWRRMTLHASRKWLKMASDPATELVSVLDELITLLRGSDETHWSAWLEQDRKQIAQGDSYGVEHLLRAFWGMGSFNDVALGEAEKDAQLDVPRGALYECAASLRKARDRT